MTYVCVSDELIYLKAYYIDKKEMLKNTSNKSLKCVTKGNGSEVFDKYEIPSQYRRLYFKIPFSFKKVSTFENINLKGTDYFFNTKMRFKRRDTGSEFYKYNGHMTGLSGFNFIDGWEVTQKEIITFYYSLKSSGLLERYIAAVGEIMSIPMLEAELIRQEAEKLLIPKQNKEKNED